ncbi:MAG: carboxypeptidase M32 [Flavipsychrobacter sp.]
MLKQKSAKELYQDYKEINQKAADVNYASAVLGWDQEVFMPAKGFEHRGRQLATLASYSHELLTSEHYGNILEQLLSKDGLREDELANVQLSKEDYDKETKLSTSLVERLTNQVSKSYDAWIRSRKENDYKVYVPELTNMLALTKEKADAYGYEGHVYDALLDEYEKGATVAMLEPIFSQVKEQLPPLLAKIKEAQQVESSFLYKNYPKDKQWDFSIAVLKKMGYDFDAGRQDLSEHPFTTSFSPNDVRVTTRVDENDFASLLWSSIHEGGHALYEQGLLAEQYGLPLGEAASLSIHESQSRIWENNVGRSLLFWKHFYPELTGLFPDQLNGVDVNAFYKSINKVTPSLIRTESDELTYHFHVLIRYEIEKELLSGAINVADLAEVWNSRYQNYLGVSATNDKEGVLQDVHWAHGSFGYFPTYSLGSFYAAQFYKQAKKDMPDLEANIAIGSFKYFHQWLTNKVHVHGRKYRSEELCERITGEGLNLGAFMEYATTKYGNIYGI